MLPMKRLSPIVIILLPFLIIFALIFLFGRNPTPSPAQPSSDKMPAQPMTEPEMQIDPAKKYIALLKTSVGDITIELGAQKAPKTVNSFVSLARQGFYTNTIFHRIIKGFMVQGGDPKGDGTGGPGYSVTETPAPDTKYLRGTIAMAKTAAEPAGTSGSQFFIMQSDYNLPPDYITFGKVISGLDVVDKIATAPTNPGGKSSTPIDPVKILSVEITEE
ncbi:MAG: Peptidyl-prolyl cis-trans isomerase [Microgenomates group bacterium GW2011_GWA1_48_10]|nr:MAG: Peptidyl-prolyl cis-trans isomerase [Microgenomates group bacterium GW2011_GWA1_48_10]